jgi:hypothetical protein
VGGNGRVRVPPVFNFASFVYVCVAMSFSGFQDAVGTT